MSELNIGPKECRLLADFFSLLANPVRLQILCALQDGRKTVSELADYAGVSLANVSQHLRMMRDRGIVSTVRDGQRVYYTLADIRLLNGVKLIRKSLVAAIRRQVKIVDQAA